jgi:hypothetical protein
VGGVRDCNSATGLSLAVDPKQQAKRKSFGHNAWDFFGIGLDVVRYALETRSECLAMTAPAVFFDSLPNHEIPPQYKPRLHLQTAVGYTKPGKIL